MGVIIFSHLITLHLGLWKKSVKKSRPQHIQRRISFTLLMERLEDIIFALNAQCDISNSLSEVITFIFSKQLIHVFALTKHLLAELIETSKRFGRILERRFLKADSVAFIYIRSRDQIYTLSNIFSFSFVFFFLMIPSCKHINSKDCFIFYFAA